MTLRQLDQRIVDFQNTMNTAVSAALTGNWGQAVDANKQAIILSPRDVESHNRLGKALVELGRFGEAKKAYGAALALSPSNRVASRNLERLNCLTGNGGLSTHRFSKKSRTTTMTRPASFLIEDHGRAKIAKLVRTGNIEDLNSVGAGEELTLLAVNGRTEISRRSGEYLGTLEPRLGSRLARLIRGGNQYEAIAASTTDLDFLVLLRETYRFPSQAHLRSFDAIPERVSDRNVESRYEHPQANDRVYEEYSDTMEVLDEDGVNTQSDGPIVELANQKVALSEDEDFTAP